jgi:hypothetical protein
MGAEEAAAPAGMGLAARLIAPFERRFNVAAIAAALL